MSITLEKYILAIVTINKEQLISGGAPVFLAKNQEEQQRTAFLLEKIFADFLIFFLLIEIPFSLSKKPVSYTHLTLPTKRIV